MNERQREHAQVEATARRLSLPLLYEDLWPDNEGRSGEVEPLKASLSVAPNSRLSMEYRANLEETGSNSHDPFPRHSR